MKSAQLFLLLWTFITLGHLDLYKETSTQNRYLMHCPISLNIQHLKLKITAHSSQFQKYKLRDALDKLVLRKPHFQTKIHFWTPDIFAVYLDSEYGIKHVLLRTLSTQKLVKWTKIFLTIITAIFWISSVQNILIRRSLQACMLSIIFLLFLIHF